MSHDIPIFGDKIVTLILLIIYYNSNCIILSSNQE